MKLCDHIQIFETAIFIKSTKIDANEYYGIETIVYGNKPKKCPNLLFNQLVNLTLEEDSQIVSTYFSILWYRLSQNMCKLWGTSRKKRQNAYRYMCIVHPTEGESTGSLQLSNVSDYQHIVHELDQRWQRSKNVNKMILFI